MVPGTFSFTETLPPRSIVTIGSISGILPSFTMVAIALDEEVVGSFTSMKEFKAASIFGTTTLIVVLVELVQFCELVAVSVTLYCPSSLNVNAGDAFVLTELFASPKLHVYEFANVEL